jgi:phosphoribosylformylglycinamidine cyclo-ligase
VLAGIGGFGAFYDASFKGMQAPVLVSSTDGVGTKLKIAFLMEKHDSVGQDLVNHCVNDIAVCGAVPLYFMDYLAVGKLDIRVAEAIIDGMVVACNQNGCSLVGGETAEMPDFYREKEYDLAGTIVGVVEKKKIIDGRKVRKGDVLVALPSTGLHTNGFSLARRVLFDRFEFDDYIDELGGRLGETLLTVHRSYLKAIRSLAGNSSVHAFAHITGGGIVGNTSRVVPKGFHLKIDWHSWKIPAIFELIRKYGNVPEDDMRRTFNLGVGLVIIASKRGADRAMSTLRKYGEHPFVIGEMD